MKASLLSDTDLHVRHSILCTFYPSRYNLLMFSKFELYFNSFSILSKNILANSELSCYSSSSPNFFLKLSGKAKALNYLGAIYGRMDYVESYANSLQSWYRANLIFDAAYGLFIVPSSNFQQRNSLSFIDINASR